MARFNHKEADNYSTNTGNGASFFSLKDDKDVAKVILLYESVEDVDGFAVHRHIVNDSQYERNINCLREYNEPVDNCPFCQNMDKLYTKVYVTLYNLDTQQVEVWERSKNIFGKLSSLNSRYGELFNNVFEIERSGKKGDMKTTYEFYQTKSLDFESLDEVLEEYNIEIPKILGTFIIDKNYGECVEFLETGEFPKTENNSYKEEPQRRSRREEKTEEPQKRGRREETSRRRF